MIDIDIRGCSQGRTIIQAVSGARNSLAGQVRHDIGAIVLEHILAESRVSDESKIGEQDP
jgi:hypothetical protein